MIQFQITSSLPRSVANKLAEIQKPINDLKEIFVDVGPGGTSSIRTGVSIANALSYALNIPSYPVASCELIHSFVSEKEPNKDRETNAIVNVGFSYSF